MGKWMSLFLYRMPRLENDASHIQHKLRFTLNKNWKGCAQINWFRAGFCPTVSESECVSVFWIRVNSQKFWINAYMVYSDRITFYCQCIIQCLWCLLNGNTSDATVEISWMWVRLYMISFRLSAWDDFLPNTREPGTNKRRNTQIYVLSSTNAHSQIKKDKWTIWH